MYDFEGIYYYESRTSVVNFDGNEYSGEKNKKGTPKKEPNDSVTIAKSKTQKINPKKLYFKCAINKRIGKKSRINRIFLSIKQNFLKCIEN
jgi:hypothetical protein